MYGTVAGWKCVFRAIFRRAELMKDEILWAAPKSGLPAQERRAGSCCMGLTLSQTALLFERPYLPW